MRLGSIVTVVSSVIAAAAIVGPSGGSAARSAATGLGGQIAFVSGRGISVINPDGTGLRHLTNPKRNIYDESIAWSPDGSQLAFVRTDGENCGLPCIVTDTIRADGTGRRAVSAQTGEPRWSPDGTRLASTEFFGTNLAGYATMSFEVANVRTGKSHVVAPRRGGRTSLLRFGYDVSGYAWSPDGTRLCFSRAIGSQVRLAVVRANGTGLKLLSTQPGLADCDWAPDGTRIATSDGRQIYSIAVADAGLTTLTDRSAGAAAPLWSPDGTKIAYLRRETAATSSPSDLWVMAGDGSGQILVAADVSHASWSPESKAIAYITPPRGKTHTAWPAGLWLATLDGSAPIELAPGATELDWQKPH